MWVLMFVGDRGQTNTEVFGARLQASDFQDPGQALHYNMYL